MPVKAHRLLTAALAGIVLATGATALPAAATARPDRTGDLERSRVDRVPTPKLGWYQCYDYAECATVQLPLDYDKPAGAKIEIAVLRVKAKDQRHRIGSLFLNPGGPGGSGTSIALDAPFFLSDSLLQKFDIVGVDPRGVGASANIKCFKSVKDQTAVMRSLNVAFPWGRAEEKAYVNSSKALGKACSTTGKPISGAMSTAEVARDMDVIRRGVGDRKLTYLGFSYGTALGQYYANMFPDRFRALVVDGVIDPRAWVGNTRQILDDRMHSADGAYRALREILKRCDRVGETYCAFAAGDPVKNFEAIAARLRKGPLVITDEDGSYSITYADFVGGILGTLYGPDAGDSVTRILAQIWASINGGSSAALVTRIRNARATKGYDFPYDNGFETFSGVLCTDGLFPGDAGFWPAATARRDLKAPYFGRAWGWASSQCARNTWTVRDEDAYRGPFTRRTAAPVLYVGSLWDPATNYDSAVAASRLLPGAGLLSSNNWGHTAYGTGACATAAIDSYLLTAKLPARGKFCTDAPQPFAEPLPTGTVQTLATRTGRQLPPVAAPRPASVLTADH
jgi:pimeloyl-ACP methyl ester carboxylesterase